MLKNAELIERAIAVDEVASALESPRGRGVRFCIRSAGDVGVEIGVSLGCFGLWWRGIVKVCDQVNRKSVRVKLWPRG